MTVERIADDTLIADIPWPKITGPRIRTYCRCNNIKTAGELRAIPEHVIQRSQNVSSKTTAVINAVLEPVKNPQADAIAEITGYLIRQCGKHGARTVNKAYFQYLAILKVSP